MTEKAPVERLRDFMFNGVAEPVEFIETMQVKPGVSCDVYRFAHDESKDLGIVTVEAGHTTPLQRVLNGDQTIEGFLRGAGTLTIEKGERVTIYRYPESEERSVIVEVGSTMQWQALPNAVLVFSEVCTPKYQDGRFENLAE